MSLENNSADAAAVALLASLSLSETTITMDGEQILTPPPASINLTMSTENNSVVAAPLTPPSLPENTTTAGEQTLSPTTPSINAQQISDRQQRRRPPFRPYWRPPPPPPPTHLFNVYRRPRPQNNAYQWNQGCQIPPLPPLFFHHNQPQQGRPSWHPHRPMNVNYLPGGQPWFYGPPNSPPPPPPPPVRPPVSPQPSDQGQPGSVLDIDELRKKICKQVDYYFGTENFPTDAYLQKHMVDNWADVHLIAGFRNMQLLTSNIDLILESLQSSQVVEVQGNKIRPRWT